MKQCRYNLLALSDSKDIYYFIFSILSFTFDIDHHSTTSRSQNLLRINNILLYNLNYIFIENEELTSLFCNR